MDGLEHTYDSRVSTAAVRRVDELIVRTLRDLEDLVRLRGLLTDEDPLGERPAQQRARDMLQQQRTQARARDPEGWARANRWAREVVQRIRQRPREPGPPAEVRVAIEVVNHGRRLRHEHQAGPQAAAVADATGVTDRVDRQPRTTP